jgi:hypothetical protein
MQTRPITVAETHMFRRQAERIWSDAELAVLVDHLALNPEDGDVIPGTGGIRKLRWGKTGTGKRGGVRVIYFYHNADMPLYLLLAYAKAKASDLTPDEKRTLTALAAAMKQEFGKQGKG